MIDVLETNHREVEEMFKELESLRGAATDEAQARRKAVTEQVTIELVRHSVAEEVLVYPQVEKKISSEEAGETFAHMRQAMDPAELRTLSSRVAAFKKVAPTRPHPNVPNEPGPRLAAGPAASLFDRMRDLASGHGLDD
ncbi:MAG: hemerythrin domain-containing protein [Solirubrobacteraceae bacterium]